MALLPIIEVPDPLLRAQSAPVERIDDDLRRLVADMFDTMYAAPGIGLAAVQVAVPRRVMVIDLQDPEEDGGEPVRKPCAFINPEILHSSDERRVYNEGCLSIPDQYAEIERPASVRARWLDEQGQQHEAEVDGLLATCVQHEVDHLNGILFIDYLSRLKRDIVLRKLAKFRKEQGIKAA
jgi:peptide deformylase